MALRKRGFPVFYGFIANSLNQVTKLFLPLSAILISFLFSFALFQFLNQKQIKLVIKPFVLVVTHLLFEL